MIPSAEFSDIDMSDTVRIERLTREWLDSVAEIERECFSQPWSEDALALLLISGVGFAAFENGKLVGYAGMMTVLDEGQITNVAVKKDFRRKGIGSLLMTAVEEYSRENGICYLSLEVRCSNESAIALYESKGWYKAGVRKGFYSKPTEDAFVMTKEITQERH